MAHRNTINDKRLTKKQVSDIIKTEGQLHEEYTKFFEEKYVTGYVQQDKVYELPGDRFLYVFDEKGAVVPGKGDIYHKDYFLRRIKWHQRVRDDYANHRASSVDHWRFYSKYKADFTSHIQDLVSDLAKKLNVTPAKLNGSYESLDLVSEACRQHEAEKLFTDWYDSLVAYVGEVVKKRINGIWQMNTPAAGGIFPFVTPNSKNIHYMPINVVWATLGGIEDFDLRKQTANEVRRNAFYLNL